MWIGKKGGNVKLEIGQLNNYWKKFRILFESWKKDEYNIHGELIWKMGLSFIISLGDLELQKMVLCMGTKNIYTEINKMNTISCGRKSWDGWFSVNNSVIQSELYPQKLEISD